MLDEVRDYYGKVLKSSDDLQTDACCVDTAIPEHIKSALADVHSDVSSRYYGCGLIAPDALEGLSILDLGSGSGRDAFLLSRLVGEHGSVVGVDMTQEQLDVANAHIPYHQEAYGYPQPNVRFIQGELESLSSLGLEPGSFDLIVSNCVINLCADKPAVLSAAYDLLRQGGEIYFSDVYSDRRVPQELTRDPLLYSECLAGALYWNDFQNMAQAAGFVDPRLVESRPLAINNPAIAALLGNIRFYSATYRLFKIDGLEPACEDFGQAVIYRGTVPYQPHAFVLDGHHRMETGRIFPVCGNTYRMLEQSRFSPFFEFLGTWDTHYGIFPGCGTVLPFAASNGEVGPATNGACC